MTGYGVTLALEVDELGACVTSGTRAAALPAAVVGGETLRSEPLTPLESDVTGDTARSPPEGVCRHEESTGIASNNNQGFPLLKSTLSATIGRVPDLVSGDLVSGDWSVGERRCVQATSERGQRSTNPGRASSALSTAVILQRSALVPGALGRDGSFVPSCLLSPDFAAYPTPVFADSSLG